MGGKASFYLIMGFSLIFSVVGYNYNNITNRAVDNECTYYERTVAHDIAVSGANLAANNIFLDKNWNTGFANSEFAGGTLNVTVETYNVDKKRIISTGTYRNKTHTVTILLQPSSFAKFAYYMNIFPGNMFMYTGDTVTGPFHTQGRLNVKGNPVFQGKATAKNGLKLLNNDPPSSPEFLGGYESGVDIPLNWDTQTAKIAAQTNGHVFYNPSSGPIDVRMTFNSDATLTFSTSLNAGVSWSADTTVQLSTFAPNGVLFIDKGNLYVKGTVNGEYTVVVDQSSGTGTGNAYIEDDIIYQDNPLTNPESTDMLGIVTSNNIKIVDNTANRNNVNIDASLFCYKGGLGLTNENMPVSGTLKVFGGVIEYQSQITGKVSGNSLVNGYHERVIFDERLLLKPPPYFPSTGTYEIVSWFE